MRQDQNRHEVLLAFLHRRWRPRGPDRLCWASQSPITPAVFLRAVEGRMDVSDLDDAGLVEGMLFDGEAREKQSRASAEMTKPGSRL